MKKVLAIIGAVAAGFTAGILTAPKSGKETRKDLKDKAIKMKADTEKVACKANCRSKRQLKFAKSWFSEGWRCCSRNRKRR